MSVTTDLRSPEKVLGIIGGIAPESTIAYYRAIIAEYKKRVPDGSQPGVIINSIGMMKMLGMIGEGKLREVTDYLVDELRRLEGAGATLGIFASNTPHIVFDELQQRSPIPLLSIVKSAAAQAQRLGLKRLALFGTRFTMSAGFYPAVFNREGMEVVLPNPKEQEFIHEKYMGELIDAVFKFETRAAMFKILDRMAAAERIDGIILGGTELPLLMEIEEYNGIPLLDTSRIHVMAAIAEMWPN